MKWETKNFIICVIITSIVCFFILFLSHYPFQQKDNKIIDNSDVCISDVHIKVIKILNQEKNTNTYIIIIPNTYKY